MFYVETSGKWPTALDALQRVKAAFCLQIARGLRKKFHLRSKINVDSIDVIKGTFYFYPFAKICMYGDFQIITNVFHNFRWIHVSV